MSPATQKLLLELARKLEVLLRWAERDEHADELEQAKLEFMEEQDL